MMEIETRHDLERGCGWRKGGGKYLIGGALCKPCGKLPLKLERCPVCDHGVKPSRGWTWIGARSLFGVGVCGGDPSFICSQCVLYESPERAGLIWIGGSHYPTPESFTREAASLGVSRRISQIPREFRVGETLVLLAHREVQHGWGSEPGPAIFAAFIPHAIEYVVRGDETDDELERLVKQGCTLVRVERVTNEGQTGACGEPPLAGPAAVRPDQQRPALDRAGGGGGGDGSV